MINIFKEFNEKNMMKRWYSTQICQYSDFKEGESCVQTDDYSVS